MWSCNTRNGEVFLGIDLKPKVLSALYGKERLTLLPMWHSLSSFAPVSSVNFPPHPPSTNLCMVQWPFWLLVSISELADTVPLYSLWKHIGIWPIKGYYCHILCFPGCFLCHHLHTVQSKSSPFFPFTSEDLRPMFAPFCITRSQISCQSSGQEVYARVRFTVKLYKFYSTTNTLTTMMLKTPEPLENKEGYSSSSPLQLHVFQVYDFTTWKNIGIAKVNS